MIPWLRAAGCYLCCLLRPLEPQAASHGPSSYLKGLCQVLVLRGLCTASSAWHWGRVARSCQLSCGGGPLLRLLVSSLDMGGEPLQLRCNELGPVRGRSMTAGLVC
jgi:hypothetical protein